MRFHHRILPVGFVLAALACTPGQRQAARTVLDVVQVTCVIANQALGDAKVAEICDIAGPLIDPMRQILTSSRMASAQAVAGAQMAGGCAPPAATTTKDAGAR